ncbi:RNA-binding motif protein, X-linked 2-like isoform X2 [Dreissena polymorpha]|uniref:RNA-binding motif protein, X-linked 2-like isoform X2 n=1 Tax=Dreissena polymorpha TaxID=45954 RepID=UPI0022651483|nr:RNA-binding motif protein, X-linked 2-like isoform X2 [Dreissena polymorpha]
MNPLTNVKNLQKLNQRELELGLTNKKSWHDQYKDSAWIFVGGLPYDLTEGDTICVFSQYGEIVNINLVRDKKTGKSKGFCFICFEDQRSTVLTVDNLNGIKLLGRTIRVDHVEEYRMPKEHGDEDDVTMKLRKEGCAPRPPSPRQPSPRPDDNEEEEDMFQVTVKKEKKQKKLKKEKKEKKKRRHSSSESQSSDGGKYQSNVKVKKEKIDTGYDRALTGQNSGHRNYDRHAHKREVERESYGNREASYRKHKEGGSFDKDEDSNERERDRNRGRENLGSDRNERHDRDRIGNIRNDRDGSGNDRNERLEWDRSGIERRDRDRNGNDRYERHDRDSSGNDRYRDQDRSHRSDHADSRSERDKNPGDNH